MSDAGDAVPDARSDAGVDAVSADDVSIDAHGLRATVAADGGAITSIEAHGVELLARTPWSDEFVDDAWSMSSSSSEWHRRYRGGWHLLTPAAGDPSPDAAVEQPFHGEAAWRRWRVRQEGGDSIRAEVLLRTAPLKVSRVVTLAPDRVVVDTALADVGGVEQRVVWVEHPALSGALFEGADVTLGNAGTGGSAVEIVAAPGTRFDDLDAGEGVVTVRSASSGIDLRMTWDAELFPRLFVWQERRGSLGFPWWGAMDAVGLEPGSDRYGEATLGSGSVIVPAGGERRARVVWDIRPFA